MSTLYLNADYQPMELSPLSVLSWRDSISAYFKDSVYIYKTHDNWLVRSPNLELEVPSIIVAKQFHKRKTNAKLSRKNLFIRDNYHCLYCNVRFYHHELTWDHVVPRSAGGKSNWDNIVAACKSCNWKKGSRRARLVSMRRHQHLAATRWRLTVPRAPVDFFSHLRTLLVFLFIKPHLLSVQFSDDTSIPVIKSQPATPSGFSPQMTPAGNPVSQATSRWALLP